MLSSISWQHYLAAVAIITFFYYLFVILRYYQQEINSRLKHNQQNADVFSAFQSRAISVMGQARPNNGITIGEIQDLSFAEVLPDNPEEDIIGAVDNSAIRTGPSIDLVSEAVNLIEAFKDVDNKEEFLTLMGILVSSYKRFQEQMDLPSTLQRIVEISKGKLQFSVNLSDFPNTWA